MNFYNPKYFNKDAISKKYSSSIGFDDTTPIEEWRNKVASKYKSSSGKIYQSSGTTGFNKTILYTKKVLEMASQRTKELLTFTQVSPGDVVAIFWGFGIFPPADFYSIALIDFGCRVLPLGSGKTTSTKQKCHWFRSLTINVIIGMPSYIIKFIEEAEAFGLKNKLRKDIKLIITGGELLHDNLRNRIEVFFGSNVYDHYGMLEAPMIAGECEFKKLHICKDYHSEVFTEHGIRLEGVGLLLLSSKIVWPELNLQKLQTGDLVHLKRTACKCGINLPTIKIMGRIDNIVQIMGQFIDFNQIDNALVKENQINYHFDIETNNYSEELTLYISKESPIAQIKKELQKLIPFHLKIKRIKSIDDSLHLHGKRKLFYDKRIKLHSEE